VLEQTPKAGSKAAKDSEVKLVVAKAPPDVQVPEVLNQQRQDARDALHAAGFKVNERKRPVTDPAQDGVVIEQSPEAGGTAPKGSKVTIVVGELSAQPTPTPSPTPTP
jgi:beta-lactam-binding protein with PASTA domain